MKFSYPAGEDTQSRSEYEISNLTDEQETNLILREGRRGNESLPLRQGTLLSKKAPDQTLSEGGRVEQGILTRMPCVQEGIPVIDYVNYSHVLICFEVEHKMQR